MATRKQFLKNSLSMAAGLAASFAGASLPRAAGGVLRPPGAGPDIRDACTSCRDCSDACPENAIRFHPDKFTDKLLPVIVPSEAACVMCEDTPCIAACGEGALAASPGAGFPAIGVAAVRADRCLAHNGSACMSCYDACPLKRTALKFKNNRPTVDEKACTGCGRCEFVCPSKTKGIVVESL
jgi:ferredoxin-type protein NapG